MKAVLDYQKQTKTSLTKFYLYNIVQLPIFIIMVMSVRKISYENDEMAGTGVLWFPNLNEPDPYFVLPITAALLNYANLSVSLTNPHSCCLERHHQGKRTLVRQPIQDFLQCPPVFPPAVYTHLASRGIRLLDQ